MPHTPTQPYDLKLHSPSRAYLETRRDWYAEEFPQWQWSIVPARETDGYWLVRSRARVSTTETERARLARRESLRLPAV